MKKTNTRFLLFTLTVCATFAPYTFAETTVFSGANDSTLTAFNNFKAAIKTATTTDGNSINWDAVKLDGTDANPNTKVIHSGKTVEIPVDRFKSRGVIFADPYTVSSDGFQTANPATAGQFPAFSVENTFAMFDPKDGQFEDRNIQQRFVLANTDTQAGTRGFGAIFVDVEQEGSSSIEFFGKDAANEKVSLGKYYVKPGAKSGEAQFLGVLFDAPVISEVELTLGAKALFSFDGNSVKSFGAEDLTKNTDLVVTDDFFFAVPEALQTSTAKLSDIECLFNWAEKNYAYLFSPAGAQLETYPPYTYRYYRDSKAYLGVSSTDKHVYYLGSNSTTPYDAGTLAGWLSTAKCQ